MKICFIDTLGLCFDGSTLEKRGLGGSESAVILMAKELQKIGFDVTIFNDCVSDGCQPGSYDGVKYVPLHDAEGEFDIIIGVRSVAAFVPDYLRGQLKNSHNFPDFNRIQGRYKVLWMHDTFCDGDHLVEESVNRGLIDRIFTLSDFHTSYITNCDHGTKRNFEVLKDKIFQTRNGVVQYKDFIDIKKKDPHLFVYNASVTKGMVPLLEMWGDIKRELPAAKLIIIGGYYKFRESEGPDQQEYDWNRLYVNYAGKDDVSFTGVISQKEISDILEQASFMIYPGAFPETFGISSLEALAHNVPIITCQFGALEETAIDLACYKLKYAIEPNGLFPNIDTQYQRSQFIKIVVDAHCNPYLHQQKMYACNQVKDICGWDTVALQWMQHFYKVLGEYLPVDLYRKVMQINSKVAKVFGRKFREPEGFPKPELYKSISVVVPVYNAENYISKCLKSIAAQDYNNYKVYVIDDASTDNTYRIALDTINSFSENIKRKFILTRNEKNVGALANQIKVIDGCGDGIIMLIDGDDWLANDPTIFNYYSQLYLDGAQFTYGSMWSEADQIPLIAQEYPPEVKREKSYRKYKFNWNMPYTHLRTFDANMAVSYLWEEGYFAFKDTDGEFLRAGGDTALFYEMIEQADPDRVVAVPHVMYHYNDAHPLNDYKINGDEQTRTANKVLNKNNNSKKKILIAIPTAKYIEPDTFKAIYDLKIPEGYETEFQYFYGYNIDQIRNLIASWAMRYDYLFSVDSDISFPADTLELMIAENVDMVSGVYRQRLPEEAIEIYDHNFRRMTYDQINGEWITEIGGCGMGCALIKSEVFRAIGYPHFVYHHALDHANTFSEDLDFCKKVREAGFKIWAMPDILCDHHGNRTFKIEPRVPIKKDNHVQARLRELSNQPLLPPQHVDFLSGLAETTNFKTIYDIGSCVLHWTNEAKKIWPNAKFYLFEAMEEVKFLYEEAGHEYHLGVLSDEDGKLITFNQNLEHPGGNSYYDENPELSPMANQLWTDENKITRAAITLDTVILSKQYPWPDLIKMDIQGAELDVLKGATKALSHAKALILELQHTDYNIGAPKKDEVIRWLNENGWKCEGQFCGSDLGVDGDYFFVKKPRS